MLYAIGDIHGQFLKLTSLMDKIRRRGLADRDRLIFIGDYVDRGPGTPDVIRFLIDLRQERPNSVFLRGNHEQMMLDARLCFDPEWRATLQHPVAAEKAFLWFAEGGAATLESYGAGAAGENPRWWERIPDDHWLFLKGTRMEFTSDPYHFVHAGVIPPGKRWEPDLPGLDARLWIRDTFLNYKKVIDRLVIVFGHTPQRSGRPLIQKNKIGIDTAAAYGGPLTAVALDEDKGLVEVIQAGD